MSWFQFIVTIVQPASDLLPRLQKEVLMTSVAMVTYEHLCTPFALSPNQPLEVYVTAMSSHVTMATKGGVECGFQHSVSEEQSQYFFFS